MPGVMYIIEPGFGDRALSRIQFDFDELHLTADDLEVDLVCATCPRHDRRRRRRTSPGCASQVARQLRHVLERRPVRQAGPEDQRVSIDGAVAQIRHHVVS